MQVRHGLAVAMALLSVLLMFASLASTALDQPALLPKRAALCAVLLVSLNAMLWKVRADRDAVGRGERPYRLPRWVIIVGTGVCFIVCMMLLGT
jgi:uncharacterized membrane protein YwaF